METQLRQDISHLIEALTNISELASLLASEKYRLHSVGSEGIFFLGIANMANAALGKPRLTFRWSDDLIRRDHIAREFGEYVKGLSSPIGEPRSANTELEAQLLQTIFELRERVSSISNLAFGLASDETLIENEDYLSIANMANAAVGEPQLELPSPLSELRTGDEALNAIDYLEELRKWYLGEAMPEPTDLAVPIVSVIDGIFKLALSRGADEVRFEVSERDWLNIRMRVRGTWMALPSLECVGSVLSRLLVIGDLEKDDDARSMPQIQCVSVYGMSMIFETEPVGRGRENIRVRIQAPK